MIPETIERIENSERAVSPVIGVILMVAITVILAAVIAAFVLGFGADQDSAPQATWSVGEEPGEQGVSDGEITFTHQGGDAVDEGQLRLRGAANDLQSDRTLTGDEETLTGGSTVTFTIDSSDVDDVAGEDVHLVWLQPGGDDTSIIRTYTVSEDFDQS